MLAGCPSTGTSDWESCISESWATALFATGLQVPLPEPSWVAAHHLQLMAAIIPKSLHQHTSLPAPLYSRLCTRLHVELATCTAHLLGRRETIIFSTAAVPSAAAARPSSMQPSCPLPLERQLSPAELRTLERARRQRLLPLSVLTTDSSDTLPLTPPVACTSSVASVVNHQHIVDVPPPTLASSSPSSSLPPAAHLTRASSFTSPQVPLSGAPRRRWMQERLVALLRDDTVPCAVRLGVTSPMLVELFERVTLQPFTDTPGSHLTSRIRSMGRILRDV